jgi:hypothetical protein
MRLVVADLECFYDPKNLRGDVKPDGSPNPYTIRSMTTESYVRDPRWSIHGCAFKWSAATSAVWYDARELDHIMKTEDWSDVFLVNHHAQFDQLAFSHHYGVIPRMAGCTLSMARLMLGNHISVSLDSVREQFGLPKKFTPYNLFEGKYWKDMTPDVQRQVAEGACDEVESIWKLFGMLMKRGFPVSELEVVDSIIKMFTNPVLELDTATLAKVWEDEAKRKLEGNANLGVEGSDLRSADKFCELLEAEGIEIEYKDGKNGPIAAIAKNDPFMRDFLREHDNPRVRALAEARLAEKSTLLQSRAETLGWVASRGPAPVYLFYAGAGTLRPSGGGGDNWLNFKRGSPIRRAIKAPRGHYLAPVDAAQIECRVLHYLAGGPDDPVIQKFRNNEDPYVDLASHFYQEKVYKPKQDDPRYDEMTAKRGLGKQGRLMCGYGSSGKMFRATAASGTYGPRVDMTIETANTWVDMYRQTNPQICARGTGYWAQCERVLARLAGGPPMDFGPMRIESGRIYIRGAPMIYDSIEYHAPQPDEENPKTGWRVRTKQGWKFMWGSKLTQHICEGVSRMIVSEAMIRIKKKYNIRTLNWPYDELMLLIPRDGREEEMLELCKAEMVQEPSWLPGLPLACDGALGERYEK